MSSDSEDCTALLLLIGWVYLHSLPHSDLRKSYGKILRYDRSRPFKIIEIGTNRKLIIMGLLISLPL